MIRNKKVICTALAGLLSFSLINRGILVKADENINNNCSQNIVNNEIVEENLTDNITENFEEEKESSESVEDYYNTNNSKNDEVTEEGIIDSDYIEENKDVEQQIEEVNDENKKSQEENEEEFFDCIESLDESGQIVWGEDTNARWINCKCNLYGVYFKLNDDNSTVSIVRNSNIDVQLPDKIKVDGIYYTVTDIGEEAFYQSNNLSSITLPNSITSIGDYAFGFCKKLNSIIISEGLLSIGNYSFFSCNNLSSIKIPNTVSNIGEYAFSVCKNLTEINIPNNTSKINEGTFYYCNKLSKVLIPDKVTYIGSKAFYNCTNLSSISLPDNLSAIGDQAFTHCKNLKSIWSSLDQYNKFKDEAFVDLNPVLIESNLYNRENYKDDVIKIKADNVKCFEKCSDGNVEEVPMTKDDQGNYIHDPSRKEAGTKYYYYEAEINNEIYESPVISVTVDNDDVVKDVTENTFNQNNECTIDGIEYTLNHDNYVTVSGITEQIENVEIPSKVTIGNEEYLVTSIGDLAFAGCENLKTTSISSDNMYYIGCRAFYDCTNLTSITIPKSVTAIGDNAFSGCNMNNLTFIIEDESSKDVLLEAGIVSDNIVVEE